VCAKCYCIPKKKLGFSDKEPRMGGKGLSQNAYVSDTSCGVIYIAADKQELKDGFRWVLKRIGSRRAYVKQRITQWKGSDNNIERRHRAVF